MWVMHTYQPLISESHMLIHTRKAYSPKIPLVIFITKFVWKFALKIYSQVLLLFLKYSFTCCTLILGCDNSGSAHYCQLCGVLGLVIQSTEAGHTAVDPVALWHIGRQLQPKYKVSWVARSGEGATASAGFVDWGVVDGSLLKLILDPWSQPDQRYSVIKDFRQRFCDNHFLSIPSSSLDEQALKNKR